MYFFLESCGTEAINLTSPVTILSPNYPDNYDNNLLCLWQFSALSGKEVVVRFLEYNVADVRDVITIGAGTEPNGLKTAEFSKRTKMPGEILVQSADIWMTFRTGNYGTSKGFKIEVMSGENSKSSKSSLHFPTKYFRSIFLLFVYTF